MKKRSISCFAVLVLAFILPVLTVFAAEQNYIVPGTKTQVTLPEGSYILGPEISVLEKIWDEAGIENVAEVQTIYDELDVCTHFVNEGNSVYVSVKETQQTGYYYNLAELKDKTVQELADIYASDSTVLEADSSVYKAGDIPFIMVDMKTLSQNEKEQLYEMIYFTIVNGQSVTFRVTGSEPITDAQKSFLLSITDSFEVLEFVPKPDPVNPLLSWAVLLAVIAFAAALVFGARYSKKLQKKKNRELADRLVAFRDSDHSDLGEVLFVNETEHTPLAIARFSKFQAYKKEPLKAALSIGITVLATAVSIVSDSPWWLTLILGVLMMWCIYKFVTGAGNIEKAVTKVFSGMRSTKAHYEFYDGEFFISGMQTRTNYPYFRITEVRRNGDQLYIYFGEGTTYFIEKSGFIKGNIDELEKFINSKIKENKQ